MNLSDDELYQKLLAAAFCFVSYRPRSEKEIRDFLTKKLIKRKVTPDKVLPRVMSRLSDLGYVDDIKFASWWRQQRSSFRPLGRRALELELAKKGIAKEVIIRVLDEVRYEGGSEKELAQKAIQRRLSAWRKLPLLAQKKKIYQFLLRRGFESEVVTSVIDELLPKE